MSVTAISAPFTPCGQRREREKEKGEREGMERRDGEIRGGGFYTFRGECSNRGSKLYMSAPFTPCGQSKEREREKGEVEKQYGNIFW